MVYVIGGLSLQAGILIVVSHWRSRYGRMIPVCLNMCFEERADVMAGGASSAAGTRATAMGTRGGRATTTGTVRAGGSAAGGLRAGTTILMSAPRIRTRRMGRAIGGTTGGITTGTRSATRGTIGAMGGTTTGGATTGAAGGTRLGARFFLRFSNGRCARGRVLGGIGSM